MKTQPTDVVPGGAYQFAGVYVIVTAVKPKGRGWYVEYRPLSDYGMECAPTRIGLEPFRRLAQVNQMEVA